MFCRFYAAICWIGALLFTLAISVNFVAAQDTGAADNGDAPSNDAESETPGGDEVVAEVQTEEDQEKQRMELRFLECLENHRKAGTLNSFTRGLCEPTVALDPFENYTAQEKPELDLLQRFELFIEREGRV